MIVAIAIVVTAAACAAAVFFFIKYRSAMAQGRTLLDKYGGIIDRDQAIEQRNSTVKELEGKRARLETESAARTAELDEAYAKARSQLDSLSKELALLEESVEMHSYGIYKPHYDFSTSEEYRAKLDALVEFQKELVKSGGATLCNTQWTVGGSAKEGERMTKMYSKLMLRAFNGECDAATAKVRWNNVTVMEERIRRAFEAINKLGSSHHIVITERYQEAKLDQLRLEYEYQEKVHQEREEQRRIQEQMREEERARREYEREVREAERDEEALRKAMDKAELRIAEATAEQRAKYETQLAELSAKLKEAEERSQRAKSMAEQTKRGHVYIISNLGSFGEHVYKIGLTRRLEPLDRVRELGDSSVPFEFDVHAMIYSEDAPALETQLHNHFLDMQMNKVNYRKEFFKVELAHIREEVTKLGLDVRWTLAAEAREYRETLAIEEAIKGDPAKRDAWVNGLLELAPAVVSTDEAADEELPAAPVPAASPPAGSASGPGQ